MRSFASSHAAVAAEACALTIVGVERQQALQQPAHVAEIGADPRWENQLVVLVEQRQSGVEWLIASLRGSCDAYRSPLRTASSAICITARCTRAGTRADVDGLAQFARDSVVPTVWKFSTCA